MEDRMSVTVTVRADELVVVAAQQLLLLFHIRSGVEDLLDLLKGAALVDAALLDIEGEEA